MQSITIRIPDELKTLISDEAQNKGQTQSDYLRQLIETHAGQVRGDKFPRESIQEVSLNVVERKTLALGYQLLLASRGDLPDELYDAESFRYSMEVLERGYAGEYPQIFAGADEGLSYDECRLAWDILDMFRVLKFSVRDLGQGGWNQIGVVDAEHYGSFRGFDGNLDLESRLMGYVDYLVRTGRWEEQRELLKETRGNSHSEMLPTYRSMLAEFKPVWRKAMSRGGRHHLNAEEIRNVLMAAPGAHLEEQ
ncbi:YfbU family protein [Corynebacterium testudinoris]|uniref:Ribbon-helix-helix protein, copG family n=1 Tax=Corynebacterium testudinoris TaxID=136857 RepID=A0A0G3H7W8_9CORY|nr:YfbU family protein [Corynebacterium testudinoris]AKK09444.1 hypothetical protein CTEST_10095 [Corynebacterium testudinoris]